MIVFWLLVFALTSAAVGALVWPLLRRRAPIGRDERDIRLAVYRDRKHEIERERSAGRISDADASLAIDELAGDAAANLPESMLQSRSNGLTGAAPGSAPGAALNSTPSRKLSSAPSSKTSSTASTTASARPGSALEATPGSTPATRPAGRHAGLAAALVITVPLLAVLVYLFLGAPSIITIDPDLAHGRAGPADVAQALDALNRRVREQPDDAQAWSLLAQARRVQGDFTGANQAFAEATRLLPQDARLLAEFAETIAASRDGDFSGRAEQLLEQALAISPREPKALALMGAAQYRLGRPERALVYLRTLLQAMDPLSEQSRQIQAVADRIAGEVGAPAATGAPSAKNEAAADTSASQISGRLTLADGLRDQLPVGATLFVSARLPDGPRMPLAAIRLPADKLPIDYALSDAQAMSPDRRLSQAGQVVIEARISRSGNAVRQSGDLLGASVVVKPGSANVDIRIDQVVP